MLQSDVWRCHRRDTDLKVRLTERALGGMGGGKSRRKEEKGKERRDSAARWQFLVPEKCTSGILAPRLFCKSGILNFLNLEIKCEIFLYETGKNES